MLSNDNPDSPSIPSDTTTRYRLLDILSDNTLHSGRELALTLGLSRSAVWKHLRELEQLGLEINAVRGRGYQLPHPIEALDDATLRATLHPTVADNISTLEIHHHLDSTNTHLMRQARDGTASTGTVCLADSQGSGRGRMGRNWLSPPGANIYLSILWHYEDHAYLTGLSLAIGVAVARALTVSGLSDVGLKWPNDILWQDKKLGGILIEATGTAHGGCQVVIGLGINRYVSAAVAKHIDQPWTDLYRVQGKKMPPRNRLIGLILNEIIPLLAHYPKTGLTHYLTEWQSLHRWAGRRVVVVQGERHIKGILEGISDQGLLILRGEDGERHEFGSGEVRLRPL